MARRRPVGGRAPARGERRPPASPLAVRLLGEIELDRGGTRLDLPPSKKTRALLAYLVVTGRPHRRDRLCALLWDVADDPRAALRWSLSRLRPLVDDPDRVRLVTEGATIAFDPGGAHVDLFALRAQAADGGAALSTEALERLVGEVRGPFCEGLELPDFLEFQAWCVGVREEARALHARLLATLVARLADDPERAVPYARTHAQIDPYDETAQVSLLRLLVACGRQAEAQQQAQAAGVLLGEVGGGAGARLAEVWRELGGRAAAPRAADAPAAVRAPAPASAPALVGRQAEWARLRAALEATAAARRLHVVLLAGEPGIGKTRLLRELLAAAAERGGTVLDGAAYEAEMRRPYGPWIEALRRLPALAIGDTLGSELAPLLPELGAADDTQRTRDRLFGAVVELLAARAHSAPPVVLVIDDAQWCDETSAELLHYVARMHRHRPVLLALAARDGELQDNEAMLRVLRGLRRDGLVEEIAVAPLSAAETAALVAPAAPDVDVARVFAESAGNPLYALEVARSLPHRRGDVPLPLRRLVRDRIERLPADAVEVLRWAAVIGHTVDLRRLAALAPLDADRLADACEALERHALLHALPDGPQQAGGYAFAHDLVRQVVYAELSQPRRRLMHQRALRALQAMDVGDGALAAELAHHAALAGDAEQAARACLQAARACLRVFAAGDADALARRGMHHAGELRDPDRVTLLLELAEVRYAAHAPRDRAAEAQTIEALAREALAFGCLAHARLGFHLASYLRWEGGDWSDAQRHMLQAEQISRGSAPGQRVVALAEAARCLTLLERDLGHAQALVLEAEALAQREAVDADALADALGLLALHEGRLDEAAAHLTRARDCYRRTQDRLGEFRALEHLLEVEVAQGQLDVARQLCSELGELAARLREGSEAPAARVCAAVVRYLAAGAAVSAADRAELDAALDGLRTVDAKHRLLRALLCAADCELQRGAVADARRRADEALRLALQLERPSDIVLARAAVVRAAQRQEDAATVVRETAALRATDLRGLSAPARTVAAELLTGRRPRRRTKGAPV